MSKFLSPTLAAVTPYTPGEQPQDQQYIKLNTNESPYLPSPAVIAAVSEHEVEKLRLYSDSACADLLKAAAAHFGLQPEQIMPGNGSDENLFFALRAFCDADHPLAYADITYGCYGVWCGLMHIPSHIIPLKEDFTLDPKDYYGLNQTIVLANPNAPTGIALPRAEIEGILKANPNNVVIVDEAYVDFGGESCVPLIDRYDNLLVVHKNLGALHNYASLRKHVLGVDELHFWDMYVPLVDSVDLSFTYEEAWDLILKALEPLGEDYLAIVRKGLEQRWIDVYETPGKRSGAYSAGSYGTNPVILTSFDGSLDDVFTLAHEMGHSVHTYLSCHAQSPTYCDYPIFVAEVASTCNEALLSHYLLEHTTDPATHAYVLNNFVESFRATLYRQCMFAEFERDVNEMNADGRGVTADALRERWGELNAQYFGDAVTVDDGIRLEWARIPHFYYGYYVYQYATSYAAAIAISNRILSEGAPAVEDYLGCLKGGSSKPPIELLRGAGVDMATSKPVEDALTYFSQLVDQLREEL